VHYTRNCITQSNAPEDGQNNCPKHVEIIGIINKVIVASSWLYSLVFTGLNKTGSRKECSTVCDF
jgi:hypothetical protein